MIDQDYSRGHWLLDGLSEKMHDIDILHAKCSTSSQVHLSCSARQDEMSRGPNRSSFPGATFEGRMDLDNQSLLTLTTLAISRQSFARALWRLPADI